LTNGPHDGLFNHSLFGDKNYYITLSTALQALFLPHIIPESIEQNKKTDYIPASLEH